jgi:hypothetical protein
MGSDDWKNQPTIKVLKLMRKHMRWKKNEFTTTQAILHLMSVTLTSQAFAKRGRSNRAGHYPSLRKIRAKTDNTPTPG